MDTDYKKRLERHIKALDTAYENIIALLEEDIKKETKDGDEKIKLKDYQIKVYSEGIEKTAKTADYLLNEIKSKQIELDELNKKSDGEEKEEKEEKDEKKDETIEFPLENHLK